MITADLQRSWVDQLINDSSAALPGEDLAWLRNARAGARQAVAELPVPNRKQESWRYSAVESLLKNSFRPAPDEVSELQALDPQLWLLPSYEAYRLVFVNGHFVPQLSSGAQLPAGLMLGNLRTALGSDSEWLARWFGQTANHTEHLFTALNTALANDGALIHVDAGVEVDRPIEVVYLTLGEKDSAALVQPRNLVVLEAGAKATLVERFIGSGEAPYFNNNLTEIALRDNAVLAHYRVQDESRTAWHLSSLYLAQARDSRYLGTTLAFGAGWARTDYNTRFSHEGAACELNGLYTAGDRQVTDFHVNVQHSVPGCTSRERFKGILYGKGRAVFDGRILVDKQAQHTDAHLTNDNLMLTRDAEVDTKPQLEIYADDVKCSHGTTVGQLDPEQVFYLRSRGIAADAARKMLCLGFAGEIVDSIELQALREYAASRLAETLKEAVVER